MGAADGVTTTPAAHPFYYSMVVDWPLVHPYQAETLLFTLEKYAAAPRGRMVVQCTERTSESVRRSFLEAGYTVASMASYLDEKYCNKIAQLDFFLDGRASGARGVFLLDLDIVVLSPLDVSDRQVVWGKIVDGENPRLSVLERSFAAAHIEPPPVMPVDWEGRGSTIATNFNGGFLYVPLKLLARLRANWRKWAEFLFARPELFRHPSERHHIDQMGFAMALASERMPYRHLIANWNFPCHMTPTPRTFRPEYGVRVLHYHWCLDAFGLIAPVFSGHVVVDEAVERVNAAVARRDDGMFFDMYKRHLAKEAIRDVPAMERTMFSKDFIARTWIGARKRRLILHAGTPKTGTSSLQWHLGSNRQLLAENGLWYPPSNTRELKHQQLVNSLTRADENAFVEYVEAALRDMPDSTHTVIFTTEGIFNHWWDYGPCAKGMLRHLAMLFDFELCIWFRDPEYYAASVYAQYIKNPNTPGNAGNVYGRDIDFADAMKDEWFRRHLDYAGFYYEARRLFGDSRVKTFLFVGDTVRTFMDQYGIGLLPADYSWRNTSMRRPGIEIMRITNRFQLDRKEHRRVVELVCEIDDIIGGRAEEFRLSEEERKLVARYAQRGWRILQKTLSASADGRSGSYGNLKHVNSSLMPGKVFCVGFHKTGTKSLGQALRVLGYRVTGPNGAREPDIDAHALSMALALATEFDAFNDNPWSVLYKELDATFPGSRFILTVRPTNRWIASVVGYFGDKETPMRKWIYGHGSPRGNEAEYISRYNQHNHDVITYFSGRDKDLLLMNLEDGDGWEKLCGFLGSPIPDAPFPQVNRTIDRVLPCK